MALTKAEQETYIHMSPADKEAHICTFDPIWMRKMEKLMARCPEAFKCVKQSEEYAEYTCPKKCVKVHAPVQMSDEQKKAMAERMKALRAKQLKETKDEIQKAVDKRKV